MSTISTPTRVVGGVELPAGAVWEIDPGHADVAFTGRHFMVTKVRGRFTDVSGAVTVAENMNDSHVDVIIGMASVESGSTARDEHLRSAELFDVQKYPQATYRDRPGRMTATRGADHVRAPHASSSSTQHQENLMLAALVDPVATHPSLTLKDVPAPDPLPGWVLVDLHRAALNRLDAMMIETRTELDRPTIFGADGAGTIHAVGAGVDPGLLGTEVVISPSLQWGSSSAAPGDAYEILGAPTDGTHAEYVAVPAENVFAKPARLTWSEAAALPMAGLTAWRALVTRGRLRDGETVVIAAATSGVGSMAIQIAKGLGAQVIAITSTDDKADAARALGADDVVLRSRADFGDQLVDATGGQAHLALDPTGALWQPLLQSLAFGGRLVVVGRMAAATGSVQVQTVYWKQVDILGSSMGSPQDFTALLAHVAASDWRPAIDSEYDLADIEAAYARLDAPDRVGKVILRTETLR